MMSVFSRIIFQVLSKREYLNMKMDEYEVLSQKSGKIPNL